LALLKRAGGATLQHLMRATGWQAHSVRGFISGALGKKLRLKIESKPLAYSRHTERPSYLPPRSFEYFDQTGSG